MIKMNRELIKKIRPDYIQMTVLSPMPGSEIYENNSIGILTGFNPSLDAGETGE